MPEQLVRVTEEKVRERCAPTPKSAQTEDLLQYKVMNMLLLV